MKKIINYLKRLFSNKSFLEERYTLNRMYQDNTVLKEFTEERMRTSKRSSIPFAITWDDLPLDRYGEVEMLRNNKVLERAILLKGESDSIFWFFLITLN